MDKQKRGDSNRDCIQEDREGEGIDAKSHSNRHEEQTKENSQAERESNEQRRYARSMDDRVY